jgi:hypothetical protein
VNATVSDLSSTIMSEALCQLHSNIRLTNTIGLVLLDEICDEKCFIRHFKEISLNIRVCRKAANDLERVMEPISFQEPQMCSEDGEILS